jgi:hypothetical protein
MAKATLFHYFGKELRAYPDGPCTLIKLKLGMRSEVVGGGEGKSGHL